MLKSSGRISAVCGFLLYALLSVFVAGQAGLAAQSDVPVSFSPDILLGETLSGELSGKGEIKHTLSEGETALALVPDTPLSKKAASFSEAGSGEDPTFVSESLHLVKKAALGNEKAGSASDTSLGAVSRIIRSVSKMKGMRYYSYSRKEWDVLYSESYMIEGPDSDKAVPDRTEGPADGLTLYCYQKEHTFGACRYRLDYSQSDREVSVLFTNIEPLYYKIFRAVKPGNMKISLVVTDCGDSYLVYMVLHARIMRFSLLEQRMNNSLNSRLDAIYKWFTAQF
jgi:hypothetical protein